MRDIKKDAQIIEKAMAPYGGTDAAHFGFIAEAPNRRQFFLGGRTDMVGIHIAEAIATIIRITEGLDKGFIDAIADTAKDLLAGGDIPTSIN